jgi:TPR repeat protein
MKTWPIILLLALGAANATARLGETTNEIHVRYGEPLGQNSFLGLPAEFYNFRQYRVQVVFKDGRSFIEALKPLQDGDRIELKDAEALAGKIANCDQWSKSETASPAGYELKGANGAVALLRRGLKDPDSLVVCSGEAAGRMRVSSQQEPEAITNALRLQRQQAINGISSAQCALGKRYLTGDGVPKDAESARYWLQKAAAKGDAEARAALKKLEEK